MEYGMGTRKGAGDMSNEVWKLDGEMVAYDEEGRISQRSQVRGGSFHGETLYYDEDGQVSQSVPFQDGKVHGEMKMFSKGCIREMIPYCMEAEEGQAFTYDEHGHMLSIR